MDIFKNINRRKGSPLALIIIGLFSLVSLVWFKGNHTIGKGDNYRATDFYRYLRTVDNSWRGEENTGTPEYSFEFHLPFSFLYLPMGYFGVDNVVTQKIWMYLSLFLPGYFMYLFLDKYFGTKVHWVAKTVGSLLYMFNAVTMLWPLGIVLTELPVYLGLPVMAYILISIFSSKTWIDKIKWGILLSLSTLLVAAAVKNMAELAPVVIILGVLFLTELWLAKDRFKHILLIIGAALWALLLNIWWLYSSFYSLYLHREDFARIVENFGGKGARVFDSLRLLGFWALSSKNGNVPYFSYGEDYYVTGGVVLTYAITVLVFLPLLYLPNRKKLNINFDLTRKILITIFLAFTGVFLVKGARAPLGNLFEYAREHIPYFNMFREPYSKFILVSLFAYSMSLVTSLYLLGRTLKKYSKHSVVIISFFVTILVILASKPLFTGEIVSSYTYGARKQSLVKIPQYWKDLEAYSYQNPLEGRVLTLPRNDYFKKNYVWESGYNGRPYELLLHGNYIWYKKTEPISSGELVAREMYDSLESYYESKDQQQLNKFVNLSNILNVHYLLQMNDFDWMNSGKYEQWSIENMASYYKELENYFTLKDTFGVFTKEYLMSIPHIAGGPAIYRLDTHPTTEDYLEDLTGKNALELYEITADLKSKKIVVPDIVEVSKNFEAFINRLSDSELIGIEYLSLEIPIEEYSNAEISYEKIKDDRYKVTLTTQSQGITPILFKETYDKGWKIASKCSWLSCEEILETPHLIGNYYANTWLLASSKVPEDGNFYIFHESGFRLKKGLLISSTTLVLSVLFLVIIKIRRKKYV